MPPLGTISTLTWIEEGIKGPSSSEELHSGQWRRETCKIKLSPTPVNNSNETHWVTIGKGFVGEGNKKIMKVIVKIHYVHV